MKNFSVENDVDVFCHVTLHLHKKCVDGLHKICLRHFRTYFVVRGLGIKDLIALMMGLFRN